MTTRNRLDCVVIGYNDPPFERYAGLLRQYGEDSEAYRDLKTSFVEIDGCKLNYVDLMNFAWERAHGGGDGVGAAPFKSGEIPNLAAAYLTNALRRRGRSADYVNLFQYEKDRLAELLAGDPGCVAITTTFYVWNFPVNEMVEFIREHNERVPIVVGGPLIANHARNYSGEELTSALRDLGADIYVNDSQGEHTLGLIVEALAAGGDLSAVPNILYFDADGALVTNPVEPEGNSLEEHTIDWLELSSDDLGATLQTRTARSCAFKCAFCNYPTRAGKLTLASLEAIERELDSMHARGNVRNVVFIDDTFNVPLPRFKDICRLMIRKQYGFNWFSYFRCSNSDEEAVELMAASGCKGVFLGIESGSPSVLENMNKKASADHYRRGIEMLRRHGILTFGSFIVGFPGESAATVAETVEFIRENKVDYFRAQMWYNEAGTPIHQQKEKYGITGDGFVWTHDSMDSLEAMDHIERMILTIEDSQWLPQWSFDFWYIPYLLGKGVSLDQFKRYMERANRMLTLEIASVPAEEKAALQQGYLAELVDEVRSWKLTS
ncbi:MAG TPA: PhpK family radical SAM P-methyltransferase [Thermoanaerobaculia bacterium]|nr:PhpK family radical SAM P-methyltransferase [Thermoanaerobaculia bacterium]